MQTEPDEWALLPHLTGAANDDFMPFVEGTALGSGTPLCGWNAFDVWRSRIKAAYDARDDLEKRASEQTRIRLACKVELGSSMSQLMQPAFIHFRGTSMRTLRHPGQASMKDDKIIAALNRLIETSKDGEKELTRAAEEAQEHDLARAFSDAEEANRTASSELQDQVRLLGGTAVEEGSLKGAARRGWRSVKSMLGTRDDNAIMDEGERCQSNVRGRYADALELDLPLAIHSVVERNHRAIVDTHYSLLDWRNRSKPNGARALRAND